MPKYVLSTYVARSKLFKQLGVDCKVLLGQRNMSIVDRSELVKSVLFGLKIARVN